MTVMSLKITGLTLFDTAMSQPALSAFVPVHPCPPAKHRG